jgi:hypothetical protein
MNHRNHQTELKDKLHQNGNMKQCLTEEGLKKRQEAHREFFSSGQQKRLIYFSLCRYFLF